MPSETGSSTFASGAVLGGRYRLERRIARGGMSTVWFGRDLELDRPVAVKALSDVLAEDPSYAARFRREAKLAASVSHPNLVRIFDFSGEAERPYLVMEYVAGGTLAERLAGGTLGELDPERLVYELLGAVASIHAEGIVHRDVKPSNVLIGADGRSRLTDFGIAQPEDATQLTQTGQVIGTLKYMAPEVREGRLATERSDLYSCGVVLGECLESKPRDHLLPLAERLTAADPGERPPSARAALELLDTAPISTTAAVQPPLTSVVSRSRVIEISGRRILALAAAAVLAAVLVAVALGGGGSGPKRSGASGSKTPSVSTITTTATRDVTVPPPAPKKPPPKPKPEAKGDEHAPPGQEKKAGEGG